MDEQSLIQEQIDYYRRRAPEYDRTSSPAPDDPLALVGTEIQQGLDAFKPSGAVLEIASGTGTWTRLLLQHASSVTALDPAPEMHHEARLKLGDDERVRYIEANIFTWDPDRLYDVAFFANWLSHVPPTLFDTFWTKVASALAPNGRVFVVDQTKDAWRHQQIQETFVGGEAAPVVRRPLQDGTTFNVIKVLWDPDELAERVRMLGWNISVNTVGAFFWAEAARS